MEAGLGVTQLITVGMEIAEQQFHSVPQLCPAFLELSPLSPFFSAFASCFLAGLIIASC
jgi:hypothetical protein